MIENPANELSDEIIKKEEATTVVKEILKTVGERISKVRAILKMNQTDFAKPMNIGISSFSQIESGKTQPNILVLFQLVNLYNVNLNYIMTGQGNIFNDALGSIPDDKARLKSLATFEDLLWFAANSPLFKALVTSEASKLYYERKQRIIENIDEFREEKTKTLV
jgi:transcriptional regulator with XRE-family HTH domain